MDLYPSFGGFAIRYQYGSNEHKGILAENKLGVKSYQPVVKTSGFTTRSIIRLTKSSIG